MQLKEWIVFGALRDSQERLGDSGPIITCDVVVSVRGVDDACV